MIGERLDFPPRAPVVVADEERAWIDAGVQAPGYAWIGFDEPDSLDRMAASFGEPDRADFAPTLPRVVGDLQRRSPPGALPRHHQAAAADVRDVVHLAAFQER